DFFSISGIPTQPPKPYKTIRRRTHDEFLLKRRSAARRGFFSCPRTHRRSRRTITLIAPLRRPLPHGVRATALPTPFTKRRVSAPLPFITSPGTNCPNVRKGAPPHLQHAHGGQFTM